MIIIPENVKIMGDGVFLKCSNLERVIFNGDAPKLGVPAMQYSGYTKAARDWTYSEVFKDSHPTIYRKPEAKGWGETWGAKHDFDPERAKGRGRPVKLISEKQ